MVSSKKDFEGSCEEHGPFLMRKKQRKEGDALWLEESRSLQL